MNRFISSIVLLVCCLWGLLPLNAQAQSYEQLWKQVEQARNKSLPQTVLKLTRRITDKAVREHQAGQLFKAAAAGQAAQERLTPDSLYTHLQALEQWAATEPDSVNRAILHSLLTERYADYLQGNSYQLRQRTAIDDDTLAKDMREWTLPQFIRQIDAHCQAALSDYSLLTRASTKQYLPFTIPGESSVYYHHDLLHLLARRAVDAYQSLYSADADSTATARISEVYTKQLAAYRDRQDREDAELLTALAYEEWKVNRYDRTMPYFLRQQQESNNREAALSMMDKLMRVYKQSPLCAEIYIRKAGLLQQYSPNRRAEVLAVCNEGISRYPKYRRIGELKNIRAQMLCPDLSVSTPSVVYPGDSIPLNVSFRNLQGFSLAIYRVAQPQPYMLYPYYDFEEIARYPRQELVCKQHFDLKPVPTPEVNAGELPYTDSKTRLYLPSPNETGTYLMQITPDAPTQSKHNARFISVSRLRTLTLSLPGDSVEFLALDSRTGHPIAGVQLDLYHRLDPDKQQKAHTLITGTNGKAIMKTDAKVRCYTAVKESDRAFPPQDARWRKLSIPQEGKYSHLTLLTDRALYRPGQTVYVKGISYNRQSRQAQVSEGKKYTLKLYNANCKLIDIQAVTTNEFGSFTAQFTLPSACLNGNYSIQVGNMAEYIAGKTFKVEEYKRPSMEIILETPQTAYKLGDRVTFNGSVKTFSGASVQRMPVAYTVKRTSSLHYYFNHQERPLLSDTILTDAEGRFSLPIDLKADNRLKEETDQSFNFTIEATAISEAGETQSTTRSITAGHKRYELSVDFGSDKASILCKEDSLKAIFKVHNKNSKPITIKGNYRLFKTIASVDGKKQYRPVLGGFFDSNTPVDIEHWKQLPSGRYYFQMTVTDSLGYIESNRLQSLMLFSTQEKQLPAHAPIFRFVKETEVEAGDTARLYLGTSLENAYVLMDAYTRQGRIAGRVLHLNNELATIEIPYLEDYGEKIHLTFNILKKGSLYQRNCTFVRKAPNKRLSMKWSTFRDRLQPGQKEEWRLTIQNPDGKSPADAEVLAMMYDASLDKISPLHQSLKVYYDSYVPADNWSTYIARRDFNFWFNTPYWRVPGWSYDQFYETHGITEVFECASIAEDSGMGRKVMMKASARANDSGAVAEFKSAAPQVGGAVENEADESGEATSSVTPRTNFNETAFFYPQLRTNKQGEVVISFTMPESLTRRKFNGWAHTKDMNIGHIEAETVTQKEFMLTPNLPRYVRVGDETVIAATIANLTDQPVKGTARMEIFLPATEKIISVKKVKFSVAGKQNQAVSFPLHTTDQNDIIGIRLIADGGSYSDGEQHLMPVLSNKQQITESITMPIRGNETKEFSLRSLFNNHAESAVNRRLTVELTGNPAWLAIQALPTLSNPTGENAISWAIAYYANSMAAHIAAGQPRIQAMIDTWRMQNADKETLVSQLEKNQELKNILLSETPWVLEADNETEQRRRLATLFDVNEMSHRTVYALNKLEQLQEDEGGWSWYPGMRINGYTTAYITELMLRLQQATGKQVPIVEKAMDYLHTEAIKEYKECLKAEKRGTKITTPSASALEYLYLTALHGAKVPDNAVKARNYFLQKVHALIGNSHIRTMSRAAIILHHAGMRPQAAEFINSLKEHLTTTDEMGAHFAFNESPYGWGMRPITAHVAAMEALRTITHDQALTDEMSIWLLKQKQVTVWNDPISTVDAIYALLCGNGSNLLANEGILTATIGKRVISTVSTEADAGLASVKQSFKGDEKELNAPILTLKKEDKGIAWGAVYAQYLSPIADVQQQGKELQVEKKLYVERVAVDGKKSLQPIEENTLLQVGDKVVSRLVIRLDRAMDFVQLKDSRGACFEPLSQLSGYRWSNGFGYYVEIEDAATNFFFDRLGKGVYVLEHPYRVTRAGRYQAGIATLQCAYAPEMSGHSAGSMVKVK